MARRALAAAFSTFPCGTVPQTGGVRNFEPWSARSEGDVLNDLAADGVDTVIFIRIEELTPRIFLTFSLPVLWVGTTEADFQIRAVSTRSGNVWMDRRIRRSTGGPFQLRPASWVEREFTLALRTAIVGE